jgi:hypothetical protein
MKEVLKEKRKSEVILLAVVFCIPFSLGKQRDTTDTEP